MAFRVEGATWGQFLHWAALSFFLCFVCFCGRYFLAPVSFSLFFFLFARVSLALLLSAYMCCCCCFFELHVDI